MSFLLQPAARVQGAESYRIPRPAAPTDLRLDGNEGAAPPPHLLESLRGGDLLRLYPDYHELEALLAQRLGVSTQQLLLTAGADDAIDRACRSVLASGSDIIIPSPSFEMLERFARLADADVVTVPWPHGPYPCDLVLAAVTPRTAAIVVVSPNNPTGAVATAADLQQLAAAVPHVLLMVDLAYCEFADDDLTATALQLPNAVAFRTLSKAWGLAGLRVGYAMGHAQLIRWMRSAGAPYAVSSVAVSLALARLQSGSDDMMAFVARVRQERAQLIDLLQDLGAEPFPSQGNFVLCRFRDAAWVQQALAGLGIAVRSFPGQDFLRISCPGDETAFGRLRHALRSALAPQAILFDMDGVLADVSGSYREAIVQTARSFGVALEASEVAAVKREGGCNNDWELTQSLLARRGVTAALEDVTDRFESAYQGTPERPGLRSTERLLPPADLLRRLSQRVPLAVVTGRPRADCQRFLQQVGVSALFAVQVCMEDGPAKPDPAPVRLALQQLGVERAWMLGDTVDDVRAARAAGVVPLGLVAPADEVETTRSALIAAGAGRVLDNTAELEALLG